MCRNESYFMFKAVRSDGSKIVFKLSDELTWGELGTEFRNFVKAAGYVIKDEDCLCGAEFPEFKLDDLPCCGCGNCKCEEMPEQEEVPPPTDADYHGVPT